jgi:hypothetical protein
LEDNSFNVSIVDQYERKWTHSRQVVFIAVDNAVRAHGSDQSKALHPDWRESSGIALPTVEELHYAHHFLDRLAERRLKEVSPARVPPRSNYRRLSQPVAAMETEVSELWWVNYERSAVFLGRVFQGKTI